MRFDLNAPIFDEVTLGILALTGTPLPPPEAQKDTFKSIAAQLLLAVDPNDRTEAAEKVKRYALLQKFLAANKEGIVELDIEEVASLMKLADLRSATLIHGRIKAILNSPLPAAS